ncbi:MAG TPA: glycosyltransferase family 2 protein [Acidimicrobiales bacterium]|nr:glycosyltransferase family 2 protein [Acidimicrobiales bacterium]
MVDAVDSPAPGAPGADDGEEPPVPTAPPSVVAVVVTHNPGPWLPEALASLRDQEYPSVSVLVVDAHSDQDPTRAIASVLPAAYVRRLDTNPGFAGAANEVFQVVEGASFYLFCHDDVALAPDAVRALVEEAFRSNAGIVAPKVVRWDDTARLVSVGQSADKTGVLSPIVEPGEIDQEQHDAVSDVFCAPGGCTLVRADLFGVLHGYDAGIDAFGEDLDLSWRAQVAGARVIVAPSAVVRHLESSEDDRRIEDRRERAARHRIRTMLTCYGRWHRLRVVPQALALTIVEIVYALLAGRREVAGDLVAAWRWNFAHRGEIRANRAALDEVRQLPDSEVRRLQVRGSARVTAFVRGQVGGEDRLQAVTSAAGDLAGSLRTGAMRVAVGVWLGVTLVALFGSRQLVFGKLPAFADFANFPSGPFTFFTKWFSGWRNAGLGSESPAPTAFALLGGLGMVFLGAMSFLRRVLFLAALPAGLIGAWRLAPELRSRTARLVGLLAYFAIPLPYNAIARGRWGGLVLWAAAPWIVRALLRVSDIEPFTLRRMSLRRATLTFGLGLALLVALVPFSAGVVVVTAAGLALGALLTGRARAVGRVLGAAVGAAVVATVLQFPWSVDLLLPTREWSAIAGVKSESKPLGIGALMSFHTGPLGAGALGFAILVVAALPLVIGHGWRFTWATRAWVLALTCWTAAWIGQQSWFAYSLGPPEALLAPAAAALALSAALGVVAFDMDLPGFRFGVRQVAPVLAGLALLLAVLPILGASFDGRWDSPDESFEPVLTFLHTDVATAGPFRTVWIGDPDVLPLAGWRLDDGVAYATSDHGFPTIEDQWAGSSHGPTQLLADALHKAERRETSRLGRLLAPMGIRYLVLQSESAPGSGDVRPLPTDIERALAEQLDLQEVLADPTLHVYRNVVSAPIRAELQGPAVDASALPSYFDAAGSVSLAGSPPVLTDHSGYSSAKGPVTSDSTIHVANEASSRWSLSVNGHNVARTTSFGWANAFHVSEAGNATLRFNTPITRYGLLLVQLALWVLLMRMLWRGRRADRLASIPIVDAP